MEIPAITVDMARSRIRIHKSTLRILENPAHFRMLVNPETKGIVIESCDEFSEGAYKITASRSHSHSLEVYSPSLVAEISICAGFNGLRAVKLFGQQIRGQLAIFFRMDSNEGGSPTKCVESGDNKDERC